MTKNMPSLTMIPELPSKGETRPVQAEVDLALFEAVEKEMLKQKKKPKIREVVEWGLRAYLAKTNPQALKSLGLPANK